MKKGKKSSSKKFQEEIIREFTKNKKEPKKKLKIPKIVNVVIVPKEMEGKIPPESASSLSASTTYDIAKVHYDNCPPFITTIPTGAPKIPDYKNASSSASKSAYEKWKKENSMDGKPKPPRLKILSNAYGDLAECVANRKTRIVESAVFSDKYVVQFQVWWFFWKRYPEVFHSKKDAEDFIYQCVIKHNPLHNTKWGTE